MNLMNADWCKAQHVGQHHQQQNVDGLNNAKSLNTVLVYSVILLQINTPDIFIFVKPDLMSSNLPTSFVVPLSNEFVGSH